MKEIKCENCGASLKTDSNNRIRFCPYCGFAIPVPDDAASLEKFKLEHAEAVRQRKVKERTAEKNQDDKSAFKWILTMFVMAVILVLSIAIPNTITEHRLNSLVSKVQQLILDGDYDRALIEVQAIRVQKDGLVDEHYNMWENQRKDLIKLIEQKKQESK